MFSALLDNGYRIMNKQLAGSHGASTLAGKLDPELTALFHKVEEFFTRIPESCSL